MAPLRVKMARLDSGRSTAVQDEIERRRRRQALAWGQEITFDRVNSLILGGSGRRAGLHADDEGPKQYASQKTQPLRCGESFSRGSSDGSCADVSNLAWSMSRSCSSSSSGLMTALSQAASQPTSPSAAHSISSSVAHSPMSQRLQAIQSSLALDDEDFACSILSGGVSGSHRAMRPKTRITAIPQGIRLAPIAVQRQQQHHGGVPAARDATCVDTLSPAGPPSKLLRMPLFAPQRQQQQEAAAVA